jgi:hypothetical protein
LGGGAASNVSAGDRPSAPGHRSSRCA